MSPAVIIVSLLFIPPHIIVTVVVMPDDDGNTQATLVLLIVFLIVDVVVACFTPLPLTTPQLLFGCLHHIKIHTQANRNNLRSSTRNIDASSAFVVLRAFLCV